MRIGTSTKVFITALIFYGATFVCYLSARKVYNEELEELKKSVFWGSTLYLSPDLNNWHYAALATFCVAIAITTAGILLRKPNSQIFVNQILQNIVKSKNNGKE